MCESCIAEEILEKTGSGYFHSETVNGIDYEMRAVSTCPEWSPFKIQIRMKGMDWPKQWLEGSDLAGFLIKIGLSFPEERRSKFQIHEWKKTVDFFLF